MPKLTDEELVAAIEAEESVALDAHSGQLRRERADAWARYRGEPLGNEVEGRSQIVDKGLMDTIQWIVPSLVRVYLGGDDIGQFEPTGPEDEYAATCETEVCNWYLQQKNDFYSHIVATLTDALLLKNGYIAAMWTTRKDVMTEQYVGLADEEFAMLMQDQDVEVVEHSAYPDPMAPPMLPSGQGMSEMPQAMPPPQLHDCKVERKKADEYVGIESIPPDEMLVSRRHRWTSVADADFIQWRRRVTIGQLRAEGFKVEDDVEEYTDFGMELTNRERFDQDRVFNDETPDPSRKMVLFKDTYIRIDLSGKGTPQLWRVAYVDGMTTPCLKEEADVVPFAAFAPIIYPHSHVGTSVYDLINDITNIKTMMERQLVDGTFLQTAGRMGVDVNLVNVDDMLVTRPGGIVRVEGPPGTSLFPIETPDVGATVMASLEYMDSIGERRTGVTRYSAGLDANTLNKTATGMQQIQSAANQRIELIARTLAGGFRDLFLVIHALASKHSTKPVQMKLKGNWQAIDPRSWAKRTDFTINVGLGSGTPEQQAQKLLMMAPMLQQGQVLGLVGPQEAYNFGVELWKAVGYKNADKFIQPPQKDPQTGKATAPPPPPDPAIQVEQMRQQGKQQELQATMQADVQKFHATQQAAAQQSAADAQLNERKLQMEAAAKHQEQQNALQVQASNDARDNMKAELEHQREVQRMAMEDAFKRDQMMLQAQLKREEMAINAQTTRETIDGGDRVSKMSKTVEEMQAEKSAPAQFERGKDGKIAKIRRGNKTMTVNRGPDGSAIGIQ